MSDRIERFLSSSLRDSDLYLIYALIKNDYLMMLLVFFL